MTILQRLSHAIMAKKSIQRMDGLQYVKPQYKELCYRMSLGS